MNQEKRSSGRPRVTPPAPIMNVLVECLPTEFVEEGKLNVQRLAGAIGRAEYTVYRWLSGGPLSPSSLKRLVEVSESKGGRLKKEDLLPFLAI